MVKMCPRACLPRPHLSSSLINTSPHANSHVDPKTLIYLHTHTSHYNHKYRPNQFQSGLVSEQNRMAESDIQRKKMRVMVAMDESDWSFYALQWTMDHVLPAEEGQDMVVLVHVQQPFQYYGFPVGPGGTAVYATTSVIESVRKAQEENSTALLSRALKICKENPNIKAETLILEGDPKDKICQATEQMPVDLLVVGCRGLGTIKRAFLGSVSDYCAHHAKCPILIVKPPKEAGCK